MSSYSRRLKLPVIHAALVFGAAFAIASQCSAGRGVRPATSPHASVAGVANVQTRSDRTDTRANPRSDLVPSVAAARSGSLVRKSSLPEWMRFRYEHPTIALSTEMTVRWALDIPIPMREVAKRCALNANAFSVAVEASAEIEIQGRDITVHGWGCDANGATAIREQVCDCFLEHLQELHLAVAPDVSDEDLASYEGMLSLQLQ